MGNPLEVFQPVIFSSAAGQKTLDFASSEGNWLFPFPLLHFILVPFEVGLCKMKTNVQAILGTQGAEPLVAGGELRPVPSALRWWW